LDKLASFYGDLDGTNNKVTEEADKEDDLPLEMKLDGFNAEGVAVIIFNQEVEHIFKVGRSLQEKLIEFDPSKLARLIFQF
jgi:hypothetical protein